VLAPPFRKPIPLRIPGESNAGESESMPQKSALLVAVGELGVMTCTVVNAHYPTLIIFGFLFSWRSLPPFNEASIRLRCASRFSLVSFWDQS
jgi:hypothetical protein